ncbi:MAG: hypothetical protein AAF726_06365 [Planctomycetota bacterium]
MTSYCRRLFLATPALALCASPASADDGVILLAEGDALSNGWIVEGIDVPAIDRDGSWSALVRTDQPPNVPFRAFVVDGNVLVREGQTLPNGEQVEFLLDADTGPDGGRAYVYTVASSGAPEVRVRLVGGPLIQSGDAVIAPGIPTPVTLFTVRDIEVARPYLYVRAELDPVPAGLPNYTALLRYEFSPGGTTVTLLAREGQQLPGALAPVESLSGIASIAADGTYVTTIDQDTPGSIGRAVLNDGFVQFLDDVAAPLGGTVWQHDPNPAVAKAPGNVFAVASQVRFPNGDLRGLVVGSGGQLLAREGQPQLGGTSIVGSFSTAPIALANDGLTVYAVPTNQGAVLMAFDEELLRAGVSTAGGRTIAGLKLARRESIDVSPNGREVVAEVRLDDGRDALVLVERRIGFVVPCSANPNSTGRPGRIVGFGSSFVALNDVTILAFDLPPDSFGYLGASSTPAFVPNAGGSSGNLCLGGTVARFASLVQSSGPLGAISTQVDLTSIPQPAGGPVAVVAGETWGFQLWHRDSSPAGPPTSNFTQLLSVPFR